MLPDVSPSRNGFDRVVWRHGGQRVTGTNDRGCYRIQLNPRFGGLQDFERHDAFTATNFAKSILMRARNLVSLFHRNPFSYRDSLH